MIDYNITFQIGRYFSRKSQGSFEQIKQAISFKIPEEDLNENLEFLVAKDMVFFDSFNEVYTRYPSQEKVGEGK